MTHVNENPKHNPASRGTKGPETPAAPALSRRLKPWQRRLFLAGFSLVVTLLILLCIEGVLRLAGFGGYAPTFREAGTLEDGSTLVMTDDRGPETYFFANRSRAGSFDLAALVQPKPEGVYRVFLVGGSAAKGSPYGQPFAGASFLREMLGDLLPDKRVEVINLGVTAIASYPVLGILTEALDHEPDLVVVYAGNNEFYGAYGVASLHSAGRSPGMIRLIRATRSTATAQCIDRILRRPLPEQSKTLMETMVGQSFVGPDDPARTAAARNLGTFIGDMVDRCRRRDVPVVVCTPPCNERDLAPLGSPDLAALSDAQSAELERLLAEATSALATDPEAAEGDLRRALEIHPDHATVHYLLGRALTARGRDEEAAVEYRRAVDLDPMPWRPPAKSVEAVRRAAIEHGAILCDMAQAFRDASPGGAVGWELMHDHVHPSIRGQDLVARSIVLALAGETSPLALSADAIDALPDWETYADRLGWNPYDEYAAAHAMRTLGAIPFYRASNPGFRERFDAECARIEASSPRAVQRELFAWADPASHKGGARPISGMVGRAFYELEDWEIASRLFSVASRAVTPYSSWELQYVYASLLCRQSYKAGLDERDQALAREAIRHGRFLISAGQSVTGAAERYVGEMYQMLGEFDASVPYLTAAHAKLEGVDRLNADEALVTAYVETGQTPKARDLLARCVAEGGPYAAEYRFLQTRLPKE